MTMGNQRRQEATRNHRAEHDDISFLSLEQALLHVGLQGGCVSCRSRSNFLRALRRLRKTTAEPEECKQLSFQMRNHQHQETKRLEAKTITGKIAQQCLVETFAEDGYLTSWKASWPPAFARRVCIHVGGIVFW